MNAPKKKIEVRAFGVQPRPGVETPDRHKRRRKPTSEQSVGQLRQELDALESQIALEQTEAAEQTKRAAVSPEREAIQQAGIARLRAMAASHDNGSDDGRELAEMGLTTWSPTQRR